MVTTEVRQGQLAENRDERWQAVAARDGARDGEFVTAVITTGIYCRPSCPARLPHYRNVVFFPVPEVAEEAGFRPCKRCSPHLQPVEDPQLQIVRGVCREIEGASEFRPTLAQLGERLGINPHHLQKTFKRIVGISPREYADARRLGTLKDRLKDGWTVTDALYDAEYGSSSRLYEKSSARLGMTPAAYGRGGAGLTIQYATVRSPVGYVLAAATERGVCAVYMGDSEAFVESVLRNEYPAAHIQHDTKAIRTWIEGILKHLSGAMPTSNCRWTSRARPFSGWSGVSFSASPTARRGPTARSPRRWAARRPLGRLPARVRPIRCRLWYPATA